MSVDTTKDPALDAIAMLAAAAVRGELGAEHLVAVFQDPRTMRTLGAKELPGLAVYIESEKKNRQSSSRYCDDLVVMFDYMRQSGRVQDRGASYPPLRHVWRTIVNVLQAGLYPSVGDGEEFLCSKARLSVIDDTEQVIKYGFLGDESYPAFHATMTIRHTPAEVDFASLDDYLRHFTGYWKSGPEDYPEPVEDETRLPGTSEVVGAIAGSSTLSGAVTG